MSYDLRHIDIIQDLMPSSKAAAAVVWYQGEEVELEVVALWGGNRVTIPADGKVQLRAWVEGDPLVLFVDKAGVIVSERGRVKVLLEPDESNLPPGNYLFNLRLLSAGGDEIGVLSEGDLEVRYSPISEEVAYVGPTDLSSNLLKRGVQALANGAAQALITGLALAEAPVGAFVQVMIPTGGDTIAAWPLLDTLTADGCEVVFSSDIPPAGDYSLSFEFFKA